MCAPIQVWGDGEGRGFPSEALLQKQGNSSEPLSGLLGPNGNLAPVLVTRGSQVEALKSHLPLRLCWKLGKGRVLGGRVCPLTRHVVSSVQTLVLSFSAHTVPPHAVSIIQCPIADT